MKHDLSSKTSLRGAGTLRTPLQNHVWMVHAPSAGTDTICIKDKPSFLVRRSCEPVAVVSLVGERSSLSFPTFNIAFTN